MRQRRCVLAILSLLLSLHSPGSGEAFTGLQSQRAAGSVAEPPQQNQSLCGSMSTDRVLRATETPYVLCAARGMNVTGGATLHIEPGVTVLAEPGARLRIMTDGALHAAGSQASLIRIRGADPVPGSWIGLWIESDAQQNELSFVEVAHGGNGRYGSLLLSQQARVLIQNSVFRDSGTWGVNVASPGVSLPDFRANRFHGNTLTPLRIYAQQMHWIDGESRFSGNGRDVIEVPRGTLSQDAQVWRRTTVPFLLRGYINVSVPLEIEPGFRMLVADGAQSLRIRTDGSIRAVGTAAEPIRFTADTSQPGAWSGIWIESAAGNELRFVEIAHGGRGGGFHNLLLGGSAAVTVTDSIIRDSAAVGINVSSRSALLSEAGNFFARNALGDIRSEGEVRIVGGAPPFEPTDHESPAGLARAPDNVLAAPHEAGTGAERAQGFGNDQAATQSDAAQAPCPLGQGAVCGVDGYSYADACAAACARVAVRHAGPCEADPAIDHPVRLPDFEAELAPGETATFTLSEIRDDDGNVIADFRDYSFVSGSFDRDTVSMLTGAATTRVTLLREIAQAYSFEYEAVGPAGQLGRGSITISPALRLTVSGTVRDTRNAEQIPGVMVELVPEGVSAITDVQGNFVLRNLRSRSGTLIASHPAYDAARVDIDGQSHVEISMLPHMENQ